MPLKYDGQRIVYELPSDLTFKSANRRQKKTERTASILRAQAAAAPPPAPVGSDPLSLPESGRGDPDSNAGQRAAAKVLQNEAIGKQETLAAQEGEKKEGGGPSWWNRVTDVISRPNYAVANTIAELVGSQKPMYDEAGNYAGAAETQSKDNPFSAFWGGLSGQNKTTFTEQFANRAQIANEEGVSGPIGSLYNKPTAVGMGFLSDLVLDPTTYAGVGTVAKGAKAVELAKGVETAGKAATVVDKGAQAASTGGRIKKAFDVAAQTPTGQAAVAAKTSASVKITPRIEKILKSRGAKELAVADRLEAAKPLSDALDATPILATGKVGEKAARDIAKAAEKEFHAKSVLNGIDTSDDAFKAEKALVGKTAVESAADAARVEVTKQVKAQNAMEKAIRETRPLALKILGKPVIKSELAGKALAAPKNAVKATKVGKAVGEAFVPGYDLANKAVHVIKQRVSNVGAQKYETQIKEIQTVFKGTSKKERELIHTAIEQGTIDKLPPKLVEPAEHLKRGYNDIAVIEHEAGLLPQSAVTDNYVYQVLKKKPPAFGPGSLPKGEKKFASTADAITAGAKPETDAAVAYAHRLAKSHREVAKISTFQEYGKTFGVTAKANTRMSKNLKKLEEAGTLTNGSDIDKSLKGIYFDTDIANDLKKVAATFKSEKVPEKIGRLYDSVLGKWKLLATAPNPGFHARNLMGDVYMNFLDGVVNPHVYDQAASVLRSGNHSKAANKIIATIDGTKYTAEDFKLAYEAQGLKSGFFHAETGIIPKPVAGAVTSALRNASETREDWTRMAHFIDSIKDEASKGAKNLDDAAELAAARVRKYNFDYQDLTHFERTVMKRILPFYTFTRKNVPIQMESLFLKPGRVAVMPKAQRALQMMINPNASPENGMPLPGITGVIPEWMRDVPHIQTTPEQEGQNATLFAPDLPFGQAGSFFGGFVENPTNPWKGLQQGLKEGSGLLNPGIKTAIELGSGRSTQTGAPVDTRPTAVASSLIPFARVATSDMGRLPEKQSPKFTININGKAVEIPENWLNWATGIGMRSVSPQRIKSELMRQMDITEKELKTNKQERIQRAKKEHNG